MAEVFIYVHDLRSSGVVVNAITFARRIAADRPTALVAGTAEGFFRAEAARGPFELIVLAERAGPFPKFAAALRLRRLLRHRPPKLLMSAGNHGHATPWLALRGIAAGTIGRGIAARTIGRGIAAGAIGRVYIISNEVARGTGLRTRLRLLWMAALARDADRLILVGRALARVPVFARALAEGRAIEVPNGVDVDRARALAAAPVPHPWFDSDVPVVLGIGRLRPQKNFDLLIAAAGRARAERRLRLVIVGGGSAEERRRSTALATAAGLGDDFLLAGETGNVFAWLARAGVFALSSSWETSSLTLLEALAVGTPVVASRIAGDAARVLDEGRFGVLFDGRSADQLAAALLVQLSPARVLPGSRAAAYAQSATADAHAAVVDAVLAISTPAPLA